MKNIVLTYGCIAGTIVSLMMVVGSYTCYHDAQFKPNMFWGYGGMVVAFAFITIGILKFRNQHNQGSITFGKAFQIGLLIALITSTFYVVVWLIEYYLFVPDFMDKYVSATLKVAQENGITGAALEAQKQQLQMYQDWYKNPLLLILLTYAEILPLGILVALLSALALKRKSKA